MSVELYQEFQMSGLTTEQLQMIGTQPIATRELEAKVHELTRIFQAYERELEQHRVAIADPLTWLTDYLDAPNAATQREVTQTLYIVTGFSAFQAKEFHLIQTLMTKSQVLLDLVLDQVQMTPEPTALFYDAHRTYLQCVAAAKAQHIAVEPEEYILALPEATPSAKSRRALADFWYSTQQQVPIKKAPHISDYATIWQVETPEEEIRQIGLEIKRLVSREDPTQDFFVTYKDIQLLTLDMAQYAPYIEPIFKELQIPFYLDQEKSLRQHPIVQFLTTWIDLDRYYYRESDIFTLLKSELFLPLNFDSSETAADFRQLVDQTENISLAHHLTGSLWIRKEDWEVFDYDRTLNQLVKSEVLSAQTNQLRRAFYTQLYQPLQDIKQAKTMQEGATRFYQFLLDAQFETRVTIWRNEAVANGALDEARNHEQTWQNLMDILDEFVEIYQDEPFDWSIFTTLLVSSLENMSFGKIPTSLDQVQINRLDLARPNQSHITFAIGLTETVFPRKVENHTLLDTSEREWLNTQLGDGGYLLDRAQETRQKEPFVAYSVFLSSTKKLYLTYPATSETEHRLKPSPYLTRLFAILQETTKTCLTLASDPLTQVSSYRGLIRQLNTLTREAKEGQRTLSTTWTQLQQKVMQSELSELATKVFKSLTDQNVPIALTPDQAQALYGREMYSSVSRLETFHQCEYRYFMQYGLRLEERQIYGITPAVTGEFFHEALDRFLSVLIRQNLSLTSISETQRRDFMEEVLQEIFGQTRYQLLQRSSRMEFLFHQLSKTIDRVSWALQEQSRKTALTPVQTEILFGQVAAQTGIKGLELDLASGGKLHVRGKIDRIDQVDIEEQTYVSVVDYKSGVKEFDPTEVYYGLAMQLVTYLDVALRDAAELVGKTNVKPAGAFYLHMSNPKLGGEVAVEQREAERLKKFKYAGLFIEDAALFSAYDTSLTAKETSEIFPIKMNKEEQYQKGTRQENKFYTLDDVDTLRTYNRENMRQSADRLQSGALTLEPTLCVAKQSRACDHCPFRSVCKFDALLPENQYRKIESQPKAEILKKMEDFIHE